MRVNPRRRRGTRGSARHAELERRVADLEAEVSEMRRHNLRLAELTDVVEELLVPMSGRDEERIRQAIDQFNASV